MEQVEYELNHCRELCDLGKYAQAAKDLRASLSEFPDLRLAAELGKVLMQQGRMKEAFDAISNGLEIGPSSDKEGLIRIQMQMQQHLLEPYLTCSYQPSLERAAALYQEYQRILKADQTVVIETSVVSYP